MIVGRNTSLNSPVRVALRVANGVLLSMEFGRAEAAFSAAELKRRLRRLEREMLTARSSR